MLKMTDVELGLVSDISMYLFVGKGMRGGISYIAKRYSKVNNKYMKSYDDSKPNKFIPYLDANNLYGWAISQYLLYHVFKCLNEKEIDGSNVNMVSENSLHGYILDVDLEYPDELHELDNDYPWALEQIKTDHGMLSRYCSDISDQYGTKVAGVDILVPKQG